MRGLPTEFTHWLQRGEFCCLIALFLGYILLQTFAQGALSLRKMHQTGAWILLIPWLLAGSSAGEAYQGARALGWIGEGTGTTIRTIHKSPPSGPPYDIDYLLYVPGCCSYLEIPGFSGEVAEIPISKETYKGHTVGSEIHVVEMPGEPFTFELLDDIRAAWPFYVLWALGWTLVALLLTLVGWQKMASIGRASSESED